MTPGNSGALPNIVSFDSGNHANATLTGGNTWTGNNLFTVGPTGAGLYLISVHFNSTNVPIVPMVDVGGTGNSGSSLYGHPNGAAVTNSGMFQAPHQQRGESNHLVWLAAGTTLQVRGVSYSTVLTGVTVTDGSCNWSIAKIK
jgi:hypothetical protein